MFRLSGLFPRGLRAGVLVGPEADDELEGAWRGKTGVASASAELPTFYGSKSVTKGVVGLSFASQGDAAPVCVATIGTVVADDGNLVDDAIGDAVIALTTANVTVVEVSAAVLAVDEIGVVNGVIDVVGAVDAVRMYGLYEFVVMPFGLYNAPGTFQHAMNRIFHDYLDKFVIMYLDDILIFSKIVEEHVAHLDKVRSLLRQHKFKINREKCEFGRTRVLYLGHEISAEGLKPDDAKLTSIRDWPRPQSVTEMRSFSGMTGYYRTFVKNYSIVAAPLTNLTRLDTPWEWTDECKAAFRHLKHVLTHYEVLKLPDPDKPFIVTTDASQYGIGAVLAQQEGPKLRPVEYISKKMPSQKLAKSTYEKELYAVYKALTHWRHYLLGRPDFSGALITEFDLTDNVTQSLVEAYREYQFMFEIIRKLQAKDKKTSAEFELVNGLLFLEKAGNKRLCVPNSESLRSLFLAGMDFMDTLITSKSGMRHIFVIVDRFSEYARLVALSETAKTEYVILMFKENWVRDFGLPKSIISDRDVRFTSELWKTAAAEQGTQLQRTSGNHPEANGQAEQLNRVVRHLLRHYIKPNQVDWDEKLALIANLYNNAVHSATRVIEEVRTEKEEKPKKLLGNAMKSLEVETSKSDEKKRELSNPPKSPDGKKDTTIQPKKPKRKEKIKMKLPFTFCNKKDESLLLWIVEIQKYWSTTPVEPESEVAFSTSCLGGEAKEWVLAEANAAGFDDIGEWARTLNLKHFLGKIKERFLDKTTADKAFDQLTTIGQKHWTFVESLSRDFDRLLQVLGLNLQDNQVLYIYFCALPEPIRGQLVAESKSDKYNYRQFRDLALQREQMTSQVKNSYASVVKFGGGAGIGKRILERQKLQDHTLVIFDDDTVEKWPLEVEGVASSIDAEKGEVTVAVVNKGGPRPPVMKKKKSRSFPEHPGIAAGKPWENMGMSQETWQEKMDNAQCVKCGTPGHVIAGCPLIHNKQVPSGAFTEFLRQSLGSAIFNGILTIDRKITREISHVDLSFRELMLKSSSSVGLSLPPPSWERPASPTSLSVSPVRDDATSIIESVKGCLSSDGLAKETVAGSVLQTGAEVVKDLYGRELDTRKHTISVLGRTSDQVPHSFPMLPFVALGVPQSSQLQGGGGSRDPHGDDVRTATTEPWGEGRIENGGDDGSSLHGKKHAKLREDSRGQRCNEVGGRAGEELQSSSRVTGDRDSVPSQSGGLEPSVPDVYVLSGGDYERMTSQGIKWLPLAVSEKDCSILFPGVRMPLNIEQLCMRQLTASLRAQSH
ncbi:hypothetical protein CBR_g12978 [Chara braunii]|uniref:Integrase catalytic domain-containing protein n=1 Tax=Chara braunii TaxID=69332 RepID=A0A388KT73_CHABU|nr:hypothetical protein CBR_g12978 [Chara braunii]|eukprot:GBG73260.1 hypothetical protein CBR_g12978 [Chara braunii]